MASLIVFCKEKGSIFINGGFFCICEGNSVTVPLGSENTVINYFPFDGEFCPLCFEISKNPSIHGGESTLCKWNEEIFELTLCPKEYYKPVAPITVHQTMWGKGYAGICGGFFCTEFDGKTESCSEPAEKFEILSEKYALIKSKNTVTIVNKSCEQRMKIENVINYSVSHSILSVEFSPGKMDFFTVLQQYETKEMTIVKNEIIKSETETVSDRIRCFCQAVRLNMEDAAAEFMTEGLKKEMEFSSVREFLGNFDETDTVRYGGQRENSIALKYKIDKWNYVCGVYTFKLKNGLIDDIEQI